MAARSLVWIRRDLRVFDNPSLVRALAESDEVVPVFCLDPRLVHGRFPSPGRTAFLLESLQELRGALRARGGDLILRTGRPHEELPRLAAEVGAERVFAAGDVSPYARARDAAVGRRVDLRLGPGNFCAEVGSPATQAGKPFTVFSPFHRLWRTLPRRDVHDAPGEIPVPRGIDPGEIPALADLGLEQDLLDPLPAGEAAARSRADEWFAGPVDLYHQTHNRMAGGTSELSPAIHFGCVSARELEQRAMDRPGPGPDAFRRQLGWRDFYAHVLVHNPGNAFAPQQDRYADLEFDDDPERLAAWREGRTGFPVVDAGMRQLATIGWMHNRARLVVASFLTRDLHLDYRAGEAHFMAKLLCGDEAQNNGNWQWGASVGVDPAPHFRRVFNPTLQAERFDPDGEYIRRWVPELALLPTERLFEPWKMPRSEQEAYGCVIGRDYPAPIVDHAVERREALARYRALSA